MTNKNKILSGIAATIASVSLLAGTTGTAQAAPAPAVVTAQAQATAQGGVTQTLYRNGAKKATIKPSTKGVPVGAKVTSSKVTVKKGKKTVAKNKTSYKAKKGSYKVTSTVKYQPKVKKTVPAGEVYSSDCKVTSKKIVKDFTNTEYDSWDGTYTVSGQVDVQYTGTCTTEVYLNGKFQNINWTAKWTETDYVYIWGLTSGQDWEGAKLADTYRNVGDWAHPGSWELDTLPTYATYGSTRTVTNTRTVVVK